MNPYRQWLELDTNASSLNHYELLGLTRFEDDAEKILHAADRALAQVRSHRPGAHAAAWSKLLDELAQAKKCLRDATSKTRYDRSLRAELNAESPHPRQDKGTPAEQPEIALVNQLPDLFPPGMKPSESTTKPTKKPTTPAAPSSAASTPSSTSGQTPKAKPATSHSHQAAALAPTPPKKKPPPPPSSTVPRAGRLLDDPYEESAAGDSMLSDTVPTAPVNAHVAPPREEKSSMLPIAVSVAAVVIVATTIVMFLAMGGSFGDSSTTPSETNPAAPTKRPSPDTLPTAPAAQLPPQKPAATWPIVTPSKPPSSALVPGKQTKSPKITPPTVAPKTETTPTTPATTQKHDPAPPKTLPAQTASTADAKPTAKPTAPRVATRSELAQLSRALTATKNALAEHRFDLAKLELENAAKLAVSSDHKAIVARLQQLADLDRAFWQSVTSRVKRFQGAEELTIGSSGLIVLVVETSADSITVHKEGRNLRYTFAQIPPGLALAIARLQADVNSAEVLLQFGACLATVTPSKPAYIQEARKYWQQAQAAGAEVDELLLTLTDSYNVTK